MPEVHPQFVIRGNLAATAVSALNFYYNNHNNGGDVLTSETNVTQIHLLFPSSSSVNKVLPLSQYHECSSLLPPQGPINEALSFGDSVSLMTPLEE
jgi:hypothetical protein